MPALDPITLVIIGLGLVIVFLAGWVAWLERKLARFMSGRSAASLEDTLISILKRIDNTDTINEEIKKHLISVEGRLRKSIQHVKTIRFNPFQGAGQGGNHSFATAFLNEEGSGAVITGLYTRDRVSVYAKPIASGQSDFELTTEEREALGR